MDAKQVFEQGRRLIVQIGVEALNELDGIPALEILSGGWWTLQGGQVNLKIVVQIVDWLKAAGELPGDAAVTWCWVDVGRHCLSILVWSAEFEAVEPGATAPERWIRTTRTETEKGVDEFVPKLYDPHEAVEA